MSQKSISNPRGFTQPRRPSSLSSGIGHFTYSYAIDTVITVNDECLHDTTLPLRSAPPRNSRNRSNRIETRRIKASTLRKLLTEPEKTPLKDHLAISVSDKCQQFKHHLQSKCWLKDFIEISFRLLPNVMCRSARRQFRYTQPIEMPKENGDKKTKQAHPVTLNVKYTQIPFITY